MGNSDEIRKAVYHDFQFPRLVPDIFRAVIMLSYLFAFAMLVGVDVMKAFRKRAHWVPGNALVLSALTIQALAFVGLGIVSFSDEPHEGQFDFLLHIQLIIDGGSLSMCIFIVYVLPRILAGFRSANGVRLIVALAISSIGQILYELYYVYQGQDVISGDIERVSRHRCYLYWLKLSTRIFSVVMIFLLSVVASAIIAGKTIRRLLNQRIAVFVSPANDIRKSGAQDSSKCTWMDFEVEVFKSWVVTRVTQLDYVMARSVLNSAAALVVTLCTLFLILKLIWIMDRYGKSINRAFHIALTDSTRTWIWLDACAICSFVTVGWAVVCWRWITSVLFFPKLTGRARFFCVEDFWINSITELKHVCDIKSLRLQTHSKSDTDIISLLIKMVAKMRLHKLLYAVITLQISVVLICKACHLLTEIICMLLQFITKQLLVRIRVLGNDAPPKASTESGYLKCFEDFKDILEHMCMPGEDPACLWKANLSSVNKIGLLMNEGREKGRNSREFVKYNSDPFDERIHQFRPEWIHQGFELLTKLKSKSLPQVEKYFPDLKNSCWKLTAVSLLDVIFQHHGKKKDLIMPYVKACEEVWDVLSFADYAGIEADRLQLIDSYDEDAHQVSMAADKEFYRIQNACRKFHCSSNSVADAERVEAGHQLKQAVDLLKAHKLLYEGGEENASADNSALNDSIDWTKMAPQYRLYQLLTVIEEENSEISWAESSLKGIIAACFSSLPHILFQYARQCAQEFNEDGLWNTVYITGKTAGLLGAFNMQPIFRMKETDEMEWLVESVRN